MAAVTRNAAALRVQAAYHFKETKQEVKQIKGRVERIHLRRLPIQKG